MIYYVGDTQSDKEFAQKTGMIFLDLKREKNHPKSFSNFLELVNYLMNI
jgi:phosphoglycolate phosphatase-like HAD superfamily hydrolase